MKIEGLGGFGTACLPLLAALLGCGRSEQQGAPSAPRVSAMVIAPSPFEVTEEFPGRVTAFRVAEIRPQVSGIVKRRLFEQGSEVRAGQPLFQIDPAPFRAEVDVAIANLQRAEAALSRAKVQTERLRPLIETDAVSHQAFDDAVSQRDQAAADVAQARATLVRRQLDLKFAKVEAPITGRIEQALVTEGALVSGTDSNPMARIQQVDQVYVDVRCPAASLEVVREALAKQKDSRNRGVLVEIFRSTGASYGLKGHILFSGISVDSDTGDALLRIQVGNERRQLLPGLYVRAKVPLLNQAAALTLPQQAIVRAGSQAQVWIVGSDNKAHLKAIELGELYNRLYRIQSGLNTGERVVVEGMERLSDGAEVIADDWKASGSAQASAQSK